MSRALFFFRPRALRSASQENVRGLAIRPRVSGDGAVGQGEGISPDRFLLRLGSGACLLLGGLLAGPSLADYEHVERGDSGDHNNAQLTYDPAQLGLGLRTIRGSLGAGDAVDAYCINVVDPNVFRATTNVNDDANAQASWDTRLYLFSHQGPVVSPEPLWANDDSPTGSTQSLLMPPGAFPGATINSPGGLSAGRYVLVINAYPDEFQNGAGVNVFELDTDFDALHGPDQSSGVSWQANSTNGGDYVIALVGASGCGPNVAFVTDSTGNGDLSSWSLASPFTGLAAADLVCQVEADNAGLFGEFRAFISDGANDAYCRALGLAGKKASNCNEPGPLGDDVASWTRIDGAPFILSLKRAIDDLEVFQTLQNTVTGNPAISALTGTASDGTLEPGFNCNDWQSTTGNAVFGVPSGGGDYWISGVGGPCSSMVRLICLQTGAAPAAAKPSSLDSRTAFVTSAFGSGDLSSWPQAAGATGLNAGDQICRTLASNAGLALPSSYIALLSTGTMDARDRLPRDPFPWRRVDGSLVGDWERLFGSGTGTIESSIHQDESGDYRSGGLVFTGTKIPGEAGGGTQCAGWTTTSGSTNAGNMEESDGEWVFSFDESCVSPSHLLCFSTQDVAIHWDDFENGSTGLWASP